MVGQHLLLFLALFLFVRVQCYRVLRKQLTHKSPDDDATSWVPTHVPRGRPPLWHLSRHRHHDARGCRRYTI